MVHASRAGTYSQTRCTVATRLTPFSTVTGEHSLARRIQLDVTFRIFVVLLGYTRNRLYFDPGPFYMYRFHRYPCVNLSTECLVHKDETNFFFSSLAICLPFL
jgi:hypothetical protein